MVRLNNFLVQMALGLSAAAALIYEIVITDQLFFYFFESTYSLATVLSVFLFGLGIGSLMIYFLSPKIQNPQKLFGWLQIFVAIYAFIVLINFTKIVSSISTAGAFLTSFSLLLIPTIFLGAIFPLTSLIFKKKGRDVVGLIYFSDLVGAITGSLLAGFVLIPIYGAKLTILFAGVLNLLSAGVIFSKKSRLIPVFFGILLIVLSFVSADYFQEDVQKFDFYSPSSYGVVKVENGTLYINERYQCSIDFSKNASEKVMVDESFKHLKKDISALNIGLGCGLTLERALSFGAEVDVVEINSEVVRANKGMTDVLKNKNANLIIDDGLNYLRYSNKKYDSILIDIENPKVAHSSNLYTVEAFEIIENSLTDGGNLVLWNYAKKGSQEYADILYYSLKEVFESVYASDGFFVASNINFLEEDYVPKTAYRINTMDKKILHNSILW
jgi:spermidine synthase